MGQTFYLFFSIILAPLITILKKPLNQNLIDKTDVSIHFFHSFYIRSILANLASFLLLKQYLNAWIMLFIKFFAGAYSNCFNINLDRISGIGVTKV